MNEEQLTAATIAFILAVLGFAVTAEDLSVAKESASNSAAIIEQHHQEVCELSSQLTDEPCLP
jgi:hypothetical protein